MQFRVLGPFEVRASDGKLVRLGAMKHRRLLATLLLAANRPVNVDRLAEVLWPDRPPPTAASALRTYASALRSSLSLGAQGSTTRIVAGHRTYQISLSPENLDLLAFQELFAAGQQALAEGDAETAADRFHRALALWRGHVLEDLTLEGGFGTELIRLEELRLTAIESWARAALELSRHTEVVTELRPHLAAHPLRESLHELWMRAAYRAGQAAQALAAYRELRESLVRELGIEPSPSLQELHRRMLSADPELDAPAAPKPTPMPRQLPRDALDFVGRTKEINEAKEILGRAGSTPAIVAIDGVPGVGKSALAIHLAHRVAAGFPDGHLYAELRQGSPLSVLASFLRALGVIDAHAEPASLDEAAARFRDATAGRRILIVLDDASEAQQVEPLLPAEPGCAVVLTSRRLLAPLVAAESIHLDVLETADAVTVLSRLAGARRIAAEPEAAEEVARLCGGLPLALRIAGARLAARRGWDVRTLADRLAVAHRRLDELQAGDLGVRTSFQVSLDAFDADTAEDTADAFARISLLDTPDIGLAVAARLLNRPETGVELALERLVDAQLLDSPAPGRYRMHDLLRLFARESAAARLPEQLRIACLIRAFIWYQEMARETLKALRPGHQHPVLTDPGALDEPPPFASGVEALEWLDIEHTNLVAAVRQALANPAVPPAIAFATAQALVGYYQSRGYWREWIGLNEAVLEVAERVGDLPAIGYARRDLGVAHELSGDYDQASGYLKDSLSVFERTGDRYGQAACLTSLAVIHHRRGHYADALEKTEASLAIRRELDDARGQAVCLGNLGQIHRRLGQYREALECSRDSFVIFQRLNDRISAAGVLAGVAEIHEQLDRFADAVSSYEQALAITRELGHRVLEVSTLTNLGRANRRLGRLDEALARQRESMALSESMDDRYYRAEAMRELGATLLDMGDEPGAAAHWRSALRLFTELGVPDADEVRSLLEDLSP